MKRALLPILVLVAAIVVGALLWLNKSPTSAPVVPDAHTASHSGAGGEVDRPDAALTPDEARAREERSLAASQAAHADGPALDGQILPPQDCGADDAVEVFALSRGADIDELFNAIGPVGSGDEALSNVELSRLVIARTKMDAHGRFHLGLPAGTRKTQVLFAGRSWFLRESFAVEMKDVAASGLLLQAECGGWISGRIDLPVAAVSRAHELDGQVATARPALGGFGPGQRGGFGPGRFGRTERRASIAGLQFEVRALDPSATYTLELVPSTMAAAKVDVGEIQRGRATPVAIQITSGGTVTGRALGPNGEAVAGAKVEARVQGQFFGFDDRVVRRTESRTDGTFELAAVAPGAVMIDADTKDLAASDAKKLDVVDGAALSGVDLVLGAGETVAGVVTWKDGGPAAGATVTANADRGGRNGGGPGGRGPQRGEDPTATTDDQGRFVLKGLSGREFTVNAEDLTAADAASAANSTPATKRKLAWRARTSGIKAGATDVALALEAPIVVRGTVLSLEGAPVQHFNVRAQPGGRNQGPGGFGNFGGGGGGGGGRNAEDVDDEHGEFVLGGLRDGTWRVEITADGFAPPDALEVELPQKSTDPAIVFHLQRAAVVTGTVTSPSGAPVANATVTQAATGGDAPWMRGGGGNPGGDVRARTDGNGRFKIDGLKKGRIVLVAESKDWARSNEVGVDLVAGATSADVVLTMHMGGRITGEVYEDGRLAVGRTVNATQMTTFTNLTGRTDARGAFVLDHVEAGSWRIIAMPSADDMAAAASDGGGGGGGRGNAFSRMKSASADVVDGQEAHVVIGAAPVDPVKVHGKVTQGGEGVAGARVVFLASGQPIGPGSKNVQTGADGTYSIQLDSPGDYSVTVQAGGGGGNRGGGGLNMVEFVEKISSGTDVAIDLALPSARISGIVRTPDGDPAARVRVLLESATATVGGSMMGGGFSDVATDGDGAFDIQTLRAGKYVLTFGGSRNAFRGGGGGPPGGGDAQYGRVTMEVQLAESEWRRDVDVRLVKPASVGVDVLDDGGNKIANASVFARDAAGRTVDRLSTVRTDAEGHATYNGLSAGRYTFSARKESSVSGDSAAVQVSEGDTGSVRITLTVGTLLYVTTQGSDGTALPAQVSVVDSAGHDMAGMMTFQDLTNRFQRGGPGTNEQKIGPLPAGKYRVHAATSDGKAVDKALTLSGEAESRITLTISG